MGEDGTPEDTSGADPTPPGATSPEGTPEGTPRVAAADETQEIPVVRPDSEPPTTESAAEAPEEAAPEEASPAEIAPADTADAGASAGEAMPEEAPAHEAPADEAPADEAPVETGTEGGATEEAAPGEAAAEASATGEATPGEAEAEPGAEETSSQDAEPAPTAEEPVPEAEPTVVESEPTVSSETGAAPVSAGPAHAAPGGRSGWRSVLAVVAALAVLAGVGLAGYAYGRSTAPGPDIVVQSEPVTEESTDTEAMPVNVMPSTVAPLLTVRQAAIGAPTAVLTPSAGLDDTSGTAMGYRLVNSGISGGQIASVLATAFGVKGATLEEGGRWTVGKEAGPNVVVTDDALFSWEFRDPERLSNPTVGQQLEPADAIDLANTVLSGIGVDTSAVDWQVERYFDRTAVTAWQVIADQRTQLRWVVSFDPEGALVEASGFSAGLEPVASYPVVGAATAVNRSNTPPWWTIGATLVEAAPEGATAPSAEPLPSSPEATESPSELPAESPVESSEIGSPSPLGSDPVFGSAEPTDAASSASASPTASSAATGAIASDEPSATQPGLVVRVDDVVVTDARLGLAQYWQPDGSVLMLPSYVLTGLDGSTWSLIAVSDEYVAFVPSTDPLGADPAS